MDLKIEKVTFILGVLFMSLETCLLTYTFLSYGILQTPFIGWVHLVFNVLAVYFSYKTYKTNLRKFLLITVLFYALAFVSLIFLGLVSLGIAPIILLLLNTMMFKSPIKG